MSTLIKVFSRRVREVLSAKELASVNQMNKTRDNHNALTEFLDPNELADEAWKEVHGRDFNAGSQEDCDALSLAMFNASLNGYCE